MLSQSSAAYVPKITKVCRTSKMSHFFLSFQYNLLKTCKIVRYLARLIYAASSQQGSSDIAKNSSGAVGSSED